MSTKKTSENEIPSIEEMEFAIANMFGINTHIIVPNISRGLFLHECDLLIVRPTGYTIEIEIKRSISDLKRDFLKKHRHESSRISELFFAFPDSIVYEAAALLDESVGVISVKRLRNGWCKAEMLKKAINKERKKLTDKEILKVATLGVMRTWNLRKKINKYQHRLLTKK